MHSGSDTRLMYEPIVEAAVALSERATCVGSDFCCDIASGHAGYSLMFTHLARSLREIDYNEGTITHLTELSYEHLLAASNSWREADYRSIGMFDGLAGYIFAVSAYDLCMGKSSERSTRMAEALRKEILETLNHECDGSHFSQQSYDVISGLSGALAVCQYLAPTKRQRAIDDIICRVTLNPDCPESGFIYVKDNFPSEDLQRRYPTGYIDFGVAHGITGILPRLVYAGGVTLSAAQGLADLDLMIEWMVEKSLTTAKSGAWASYNVDNSESLSPYVEYLWCYGQLSRIMNISVGLGGFLRPETVGKCDSYIQKALTPERIAEAVSVLQTLGHFGICHGLSGLLLTVAYALEQSYPDPGECQGNIRQLLVSSAEQLSLDGTYHDLGKANCLYSGFLNGGAGSIAVKLDLLGPCVFDSRRELRFLLFGA